VLSDRSTDNPIVLFGPANTGKTALVWALAERWKRAHRGKRVVLTTGTDFASEYRLAVQTDSLLDFREKYRGADLLVIDDVHMLVGKTKTQIELLHTLDSLADENRAVVATSRSNPMEIEGVAAGLAGRLVAGLTVPLSAPGPQAQREILKRLAQRYRVRLPKSVIDLLVTHLSEASQPPATVVQLDSTVDNLVRRAFENQSEIDSQLTQDYLQQSAGRNEPELRTITREVCRCFHLRVAELKGSGRQRRVVRARGVAMLLARRLTPHSLELLGRYFGNRDHTTVLHACRKTEELIQSDPAIRQAVDQILTQLTATSVG
jgi:chromosomal replication initiator protein